MFNYLYNLATDKKKGFLAGFVKCLLFILTLIYGLIIRILIFLRQINPHKLNCKVISVGNITLGGTGKTVLVNYLAEYLQQKGHKVAILTRGYKKKHIRSPQVAQGRQFVSYENMGDEAYMLAKKISGISVLVDQNRIRSAEKAINSYSVDTVILDDGFQQWGIKKDLDIVTIDCTNPFGNRQMLPRGILREPLASLRRCDIFMLSRVDFVSDATALERYLQRINPRAFIIQSIHHPEVLYRLGKEDNLLSTDILKDKNIGLFSGIGNPDAFEKSLINLKAKVIFSARFSDHYTYSLQDLENIAKQSKDRNADFIVTTEKDAARLEKFASREYILPIFVLRIGLTIRKNEEELHNRLLRLYSS